MMAMTNQRRVRQPGSVESVELLRKHDWTPWPSMFLLVHGVQDQTHSRPTQATARSGSPVNKAVIIGSLEMFLKQSNLALSCVG